MSESNNTTPPRSDAERKDYIAELFARINLPSDLALHLTKGRGGEVYYAILYHFDPKSDQKRTIKEEIVGNSPAEVMEEMIAFLEKNQLIPLTPQATDKGWRQVKVSLKGYFADEAPTPSLSEGEEWEEEFDEHYAEIGIVGDRKFREFLPYTYQHLKDFIRTLLSQALSNERERMVAIGEELKYEDPRVKGHKLHPTEKWTDCEACRENYINNAAITTYQQKIKSPLPTN